MSRLVAGIKCRLKVRTKIHLDHSGCLGAWNKWLLIDYVNYGYDYGYVSYGYARLCESFLARRLSMRPFAPARLETKPKRGQIPRKRNGNKRQIFQEPQSAIDSLSTFVERNVGSGDESNFVYGPRAHD